VLGRVDDLLRGRGWGAPGAGPVPVAFLLAVLVAAGSAYGLVMGLGGGRLLQGLIGAVKVPLLLEVSTALCLPSHYVASSLLGLRADFAASLRGILASQAAMAVALLSLAPLLPILYRSDIGYDAVTLWNGIFFFLSAVAGQGVLARHYRPLIRKNPRHGLTWALWFGLYIFIAIQMAWVLRPFIGTPDLEPRFFREDAWDNAYVRLARLIGRAMR
jgi:hypothetical protein